MTSAGTKAASAVQQLRRWVDKGGWDRKAALLLLGLLLLSAALAGVVSPGLPPAGADWFRATRLVVIEVALVVAVALPVGCGLGAAAALGPRLFGGLLTRAVELTGALPSLILLGLWRVGSEAPTLTGFVAILIAIKAIETARLIAELAHSVGQREYVVAARALGSSPQRVFHVHVLPQLLPTLTVSAAATAAYVVGLEGALSFVGLGPEGVVSWGTLLGRAATEHDVSAGLAWSCVASLTLTTLTLHTLIREEA